MNLQIQCPACERRFRTTDDLSGKTVECGACDQRFEVTPGTIVHDRERFYPGEHQDDLLDRLSNSPTSGEAPVSFQRAQYTPPVDADAVMPSSPAQNFAVLGGIGLILFFALIFFLGTSPGQIFQDVDLKERLILGGFISLVGSILIILGAKTWRNRAILLSVVFFIAVIGLILTRPVHLTPEATASVASDRQPQAEEKVSLLENEQERYLNVIGFDSVKRAIKNESDPAAGVDGSQRVVAIYLYPVKPSYVYDIEKFYERKLSIPKTNAVLTYERDNGRARLLVLSGITESFDNVVDISAELGEVKTLPNRRLIDIKLNTSIFVEPSAKAFERLNDPANGHFCGANLDELDHISADRIEKAVQRLAAMPADATRRHKPEILARFLELLDEPGGSKELYASIGRALMSWAPDNQEILGKVGASVTRWSEQGRDIPKSLVEYLISSGDSSVVAIIDRMWVKEPETWSEQYLALGDQAEGRLAFHIAKSPLPVKKAAAVLIRKVGTPRSIPALKAAKGKGDDELDVLLVVAIEAISSR